MPPKAKALVFGWGNLFFGLTIIYPWEAIATTLGGVMVAFGLSLLMRVLLGRYDDDAEAD
jgi:hypothetical protein